MNEYERRTDEDLKQIARDLYSGMIYSNLHIENLEDTRHVFLLLGMMSKDESDEFKKMRPSFVFEYLDKAGPISRNGMPTFFSFQFLDIDDTKRMFAYRDKVKEAMDAI